MRKEGAVRGRAIREEVPPLHSSPWPVHAGIELSIEALSLLSGIVPVFRDVKVLGRSI